MDACVSNRFRFIHCLRLTDPLKRVTSIGPMTAVRMQFRREGERNSENLIQGRAKNS